MKNKEIHCPELGHQSHQDHDNDIVNYDFCSSSNDGKGCRYLNLCWKE